MAASIWSGKFRLFGVELRCHGFDDGTQIIEAESMTALLQAIADTDAPIVQADVEEFAKWLKRIEPG